MNFLFLADCIIPGYSLLSKKQRQSFEKRASGKKFVTLIEETMKSAAELQESAGIWIMLFGDLDAKKEQLRRQFKENKQQLTDDIRFKKDYQLLNSWITYNLLQSEFPDFHLLDKKQKKILSYAGFSQKLLLPLALLDKLIQQEHDTVMNLDAWGKIHTAGLLHLNRNDALQNKKKEIIYQWNVQFLTNLQMEPLRKTISQKKDRLRQTKIQQDLAALSAHAAELADFFPLLHYRPSLAQPTGLAMLLAQYRLENGEINPNPRKVEEDLLTNVIFAYMHELNHIEMDFINLDAFHLKLARHLALAILQSFNDSQTFELEEWFDAYQTHLYKYVRKQFLLIHGHPWKRSTKPSDILQSLSYLWNNKTANDLSNRTTDFLSQVADAHAFIQATGFSTQNENSFLAILDIYNYGRYHKQISETKSIFFSLLTPLHPLYEEYKDIAFYEKNGLWKLVRILMPIIIIVAVILAVALMLAPLGLPELAFTIACVPAFILGLALAAKYVAVKNDVYKYARSLYYGGFFEIPEFRINLRMEDAFGNKTNAEWVRQYYIDAIKHCDDNEKEYTKCYEKGLLTDETIQLRKQNINKRHELCLEWCDIHHNKNLGVENVLSIALNRLRQSAEKEYTQLEMVLEQELESIHSSTMQVAYDLKTAFIQHLIPPTPQSSIFKSDYTPCLFRRPRCLAHKDKTEELLRFCEQFEPVEQSQAHCSQ